MKIGVQEKTKLNSKTNIGLTLNYFLFQFVNQIGKKNDDDDDKFC